MIHSSDAFIKSLKSPIKQVFPKFELYDSNMNFIEDITKDVILADAGNISCDRTRPVRRSFSFSLSNKSGKYTWSENGLIWIDKRLKVYTGLQLPDGTIEYIPQGLYLIASPQDEHTMSSNKVMLNAYDKSYLMTSNRGKIGSELTLSKGLNCATAIKTIAQQVGETLFLFDDIPDTLPYDFTFVSTDERWKALSDIADYAKCEIFYNENGYLKLRKLDDLNSLQNYSSVWNFSIGDNFYAGNVRKLDDTNMYNDYIALGGGTSSTSVRDQITVTQSNPIWANSPYTIEKLGRITYFHNGGNADPALVTQADCHYRNKYNLMQYLGYSEIADVSIVPHYLLEPNDVVDIEDPTNNVTGRYLINKIDIPLNPTTGIVTMEVLKERHVVTDWNSI